ncbi:TetR family transcriptional regulator [Actinosynnema mirum]|uniref:Transcriptional regulator, TetR family n=1 Tax=Actinosynnema mirum (strain ATCC 29888 / DSM 43827 / JCM 3225 / NBRC 14064 / NCIMB 13271 / NRRL B-12336 / IMRU 3971 / 101) TaxID=446462 RepID=C6W843_ACTMD|nr:TetR family transcriptional regulator [Actinosynnema mirum]ACU37064.1 transcriptional regulator, TetR family [Actinosynnema mirum DSM 43827]AXX30549.1 Transcriptional regulator, TetR family [Actinosynnema pretiosum subsp. pretiosum]
MVDFQRARRPEQVQARRAAILDAAEAALEQRPLDAITLRELSCRVGLAKSNVLRYFGTREAVYLEVLRRRWSSWLDGLEPVLRSCAPEPVPYGRAVAVATAVAGALVADPPLCELFGSMASVLERNVDVDVARGFAAAAGRRSDRLAGLVAERLPHLGAAGTRHFAESVVVVTAGLWGRARPTEEVARASADLGLPAADEVFRAALTESLVNQLIGLAARAS